MSLPSQLRELGLHQKEVILYLALLKNGRRTPAALSNITKINRATVYSVAKSLQSRGLIAEDITGRTRSFVALPPTTLNQLIDRPRRELHEKEKLVAETVSALTHLSTETINPVPKIRFIQEDAIEDFLFENTTKWQQSVIDCDGVWWGFQDHSFVEHYEKWIHWTWTTKESSHPHYKAHVITNASRIERELKTMYAQTIRNMRSLEGTNFTSTLWVAGDYLVMLMTQQHPFYLVEINDALLAYNIRELFKRLWHETKPTT